MALLPAVTEAGPVRLTLISAVASSAARGGDERHDRYHGTQENGGSLHQTLL
ncbi:MAG TPA: hypothetical protein VFU43_15875 [Streptosporangiaceae bacterium]|nr:hypothetical protein [Streptosporangiaceae bacterium]